MFVVLHTCVFCYENQEMIQKPPQFPKAQLEISHCVSFFFRTMANLYEDPDWSQKSLKKTLNDIRRHVLKNKFLACFAPDRLKYYLKELCQRKQEGHQISFTDLWGLIIESMFHDKV